MTRTAASLVFVALALLAGCGHHGDRQGVGGVSVDEAAQLDNAAAMLDTPPDDLAVPAAGPDAQDNDDDADAQGNGDF